MPYRPPAHRPHSPPRRNLKAEGYTRAWRTLSEEMRQEQPWCSACGDTDTSTLTVDHITPRSLGGTNDRENLQVLCRRCNSLKATR